MTRILVAGIGNLFQHDDGFGPAVARRLVASDGAPLLAGVRVVDYGIRGLHLAYDLLEDYQAAILVDTIPAGTRPGELTVLQVCPGDARADRPPMAGPSTGSGQGSRAELVEAGLDPHGMDPVAVLRSVERLGGSPPRTLLVGCRPADLEEGIGLSAPVHAAVGPAADLVRSLITSLLAADREDEPAGLGSS